MNTESTANTSENDGKKNGAIVPIIVIGVLLLLSLTLVFAPWQPTLEETPSGVAEHQPSETSSVLEEALAGEAAADVDAPTAGIPTATSSSTPSPSAPTTTSVAAPSASTEQPYADKQRLDARESAKEVLAELIELQKQLNAKRVNEWAPADMTAISELASNGDQLYAERSFDEAQNAYEAARNSAKTTLENAKSIAETHVNNGEKALDTNQIELAINQLELAVLLNPDSEKANRLLARASVREQVLELEDTANRQLSEGKLDEARDTLRQAKKLDSQFTDIATQLAALEERILDRDYRAAMSKGYSALRDRQLSTAEAAFNAAANLRPNSEAPGEAIQQVEAARINTATQTKIDRATGLEASEQWSAALQLYTQLHKEDPSLTSAQLGKLRAEVRAKLDADIVEIFNEPLKLQNDRHWQKAYSSLSDAKNIVNRGPVLSKQINQLDELLRVARTEIRLELTSDGETNVEIYRVGKLGTFNEQAVSLYPGRYTVVGKQPGCRDIRHEIVLDGSSETVSLIVQCEESI